MIRIAHGALPRSESDRSRVLASIPVTFATAPGWSKVGRSARMAATTARPSAGFARTTVAQPSPTRCGLATDTTRGMDATVVDQERASASLDVTSSMRGLVASGNELASVVVNAYCEEERGTASTLVLARRRVKRGLPTATSASTHAIVTRAGCFCTRRVRREKNPSAGATSPKRLISAPRTGRCVRAPGLSRRSPVRASSAGTSVSAVRIAMAVTERAPIPMARTIPGWKTSRPAAAIAKVVPEKSTVRPARSAVREIESSRMAVRSSALRCHGSPIAARLARYSSRNRLTTSSP